MTSENKSTLNIAASNLEVEHAKKFRPYFKKFVPPQSDEEEDIVGDEKRIYNIHESWKTLLSLPSCQKVMILEPVQKELKIEVGVNVTQEFPWKYVQYADLRDKLFDELDQGAELAKHFRGYSPESYVLIGFVPMLTEQNEDPPAGEPFIFYVSSKDAKLAMGIIQNMEAFERWRMRRRLAKKPRRWVSMGTEHELNIVLERPKDEPVDVEIQSVYPVKMPPHVAFDYRRSKDVRDGYIELLPNELIKFDNVTRRRITIGVQSAPKLIDREQQTNPTFPSNSWSQYLYEINDEDLELDASADEIEEGKEMEARLTAQAQGEVVKPPPQVSPQIELLLRTLEFNQIDAYRDDYALITDKIVEHYTNPYLEEFICFANISKSNKRYVAGYDWYPSLSGLIAVSYAFSTPATNKEASQRIDMVQQAVLQPNPILLWSFSDNLNYKLEFEAPFETTALSFCPYDANLLLGGSKNGQVIIWDLQDRAEKLDYEEYLTAAQAKYRTLILDFLKWTIETKEDTVIAPASVTPLETSPKDAITGFYWMSQNVYVNSLGKAYSDPDVRNMHKFFITCSCDGTISFWDIDSVSNKKNLAAARARQLPKELTQNESYYKNKALKPTYNLGFAEPVTSIIADTTVYGCKVANKRAILANPANYPIKLVPKNPRQMRQSMILSTFYGRIHRIDWLGLYTDANTREMVNSTLRFAMVHDGPVISMKKNPFYPELFASIGRNVFAVWKEDYNYSAILWRKRPCDLTAVEWSEARPAVLYLTRNDGILEAWDILARDDDACLSEILGGGVITAIAEHKPSLPHKILGIGDYNSSIRMVKLPESLTEPLNNELEKVTEYVLKEERRKISIQAWEQKFYELNKEIIEAKREAEAGARKEMERLDREDHLLVRKGMAEQDDSKNESDKKTLPYNERMARQWDELNLNRMMTILMSRKQMDPEKLARETAIEKERLAYEVAKKESLAQILSTINEDVATIRARILPAEIPDMQRSEMIAARIRDELQLAESYEDVCEHGIHIQQQFTDFKRIDYIEFLSRGRHRRRLIDKSLGANTERLLWYEEMQFGMRLLECDWGYEFLYTKSESLISVERTTVQTEQLTTEVEALSNE